MSSPRWAEFLPSRSWQSRKPKSGTRCRDFPGGPAIKNPPSSSGVQVQSLVQELRFPCARATDPATTIQCLCQTEKSRMEQQRICLLQLRPNNSQINIYFWFCLNTHTRNWLNSACLPCCPTAPGQIHDHLEPQNGILFATGVLANVIKDLEMKSSRLSCCCC